MEKLNGEEEKPVFDWNFCTNGNCFICGKKIPPLMTPLVDSEEMFDEETPILQTLCKYLEIDLVEAVKGEGSRVVVGLPVEMKVELCRPCERAAERFCDLFEEMEKMKAEMDYCLSKIKGGIEEGEGKSGYLKGIGEELKKKILNKCSTVKFSQPRPSKLTKPEEEPSNEAGDLPQVKSEVGNGLDVDNQPDSMASMASMSSISSKESFYSLENDPKERETFLKRFKPDVLTSDEDENDADDEEDKKLGLAGGVEEPGPSKVNRFSSSGASTSSSSSSGSSQYLKDEKTGKFKCPEPQCTMQFLKVKVADKHYKTVHLNVLRLDCEGCGGNYAYSYISRHKKLCNGVGVGVNGGNGDAEQSSSKNVMKTEEDGVAKKEPEVESSDEASPPKKMKLSPRTPKKKSPGKMCTRSMGTRKLRSNYN